MGQGMVLVAPDAEAIIAVCKSHGIEAKIIGRITKNPAVILHSRGLHQATLTY